MVLLAFCRDTLEQAISDRDAIRRVTSRADDSYIYKAIIISLV